MSDERKEHVYHMNNSEIRIEFSGEGNGSVMNVFAMGDQFCLDPNNPGGERGEFLPLFGVVGEWEAGMLLSALVDAFGYRLVVDPEKEQRFRWLLDGLVVDDEFFEDPDFQVEVD